MENINAYIRKRLNERMASNSLRKLKDENGLTDFCSNDYLGFARSPELKALITKEIANYPHYKSGSTGSRLLTGNEEFTTDLEKEIAKFHNAESALLFNSGYSANVGLFSCLPQRGDTIITDEFIHASIIDGVRLSYANKFSFKHNDVEGLEEKLKHAKGNIFIAVESVYSMDGDQAPLADICSLAQKYNAALIVDEAHAIGIFGDKGKGLVNELKLDATVFARVITFGKALGTHGSAVLGSKDLINYLINFARSFIYTTAPPFYNHLSVKMAYKYLAEKDHQQKLSERIQIFRDNAKVPGLINSSSAIQSILISGNDNTRNNALQLQKSGFDVKPILSPTVTTGLERLRICLHNHNSVEEIKYLTDELKKINYA